MKKLLEKLKNKIGEMSSKKLIAITVGFVAVIGLIFIVNFTFSSSNTELTKDVTLDNIKITEISIDTNNGETTFTGKVTALKDTDIKYISIKLLNSDNKEVVTLIGYVGNNLKENDSTTIEAKTDANIENVESINYELISNN